MADQPRITLDVTLETARMLTPLLHNALLDLRPNEREEETLAPVYDVHTRLQQFVGAHRNARV